MRYEVEVRFHKDFIEVNGNRISIGLTAKPEKGEANRELIRKLARQFKVSTSQIRIVSGLRSKSKVVEIYQPSPTPTDSVSQPQLSAILSQRKQRNTRSDT